MENMERDPNIELRPLSVNDAEAYFRFMDENRAFFANFNNTPADKYPDVESVRVALSDPVKLRWGLYQDGELVGTINLKPWKTEERVGEIGYLVAENKSGQGIATKAVRDVIELNKDRYESFIATVDPLNEASVRVLQKAGFVIDTKTLSEQGNPLIVCRLDPRRLLLRLRACGGIGIRARLRSVFRKDWEFESPHAHTYEKPEPAVHGPFDAQACAQDRREGDR
jgi:RimJ/RimL family protein N-acetyltransferase